MNAVAAQDRRKAAAIVSFARLLGALALRLPFATSLVLADSVGRTDLKPQHRC